MTKVSAMDPDSEDMPESAALEHSLDRALQSRSFLVQRLTDVVGWPATRIPVHERELAGDILVGLLRTASLAQRERCAERLAQLSEAPKALLRYLARDEISVARPLLERSTALDDSDLVVTIRASLQSHWLAIASRRALSPLVVEALIATGETGVVEQVLRNTANHLSASALDAAVRQSRKNPALPPLVAKRLETSPAQALTMFWWADSETRTVILRRFAVDRAVLCDELADLFAFAAREQWADPETRKAIALLERRQRNRRAAERSAYGSLEGAIEAGVRGFDRKMAAEISFLSGIRPETGMKIFTDKGGEGIAVLCKATGLKRDSLHRLWGALKRPDIEPDNPRSPLGRVLAVFEMLATAKAQTVLRYWNWSLTTGAAAADAGGLDPSDETLEFQPARRNAALVLGRW